MSISLSAQSFLGVLSYSMGLGTERTGEFIDDVSFKGFQFEGRSFTNRNWTFGGTFGWNVFDEQSYELVHLEDGNDAADVQGNQIRYINSFPIMANGHYYFMKRRDPIRPFIGLNAGVYYISQRFQLGIYEVNESNWHFGLAPEIGFLIPVGDVAIMTNAKYNYAFSAGKPLGGGTDNSHSYISFNIGLAFYSF